MNIAAKKRRGRKPKATVLVSADATTVSVEEEDPTIVTLNMEDLIDLRTLEAAAAASGKKRKAPAKSAATK